MDAADRMIEAGNAFVNEAISGDPDNLERLARDWDEAVDAYEAEVRARQAPARDPVQDAPRRLWT